MKIEIKHFCLLALDMMLQYLYVNATCFFHHSSRCISIIAKTILAGDGTNIFRIANAKCAPIQLKDNIQWIAIW